MIPRIAKITVALSAFFIVAGISTYLTLTYFILNEDTVVVPDLVGKDVVSVLKILTDLGLNTKVKGSEYSAEIPVNHVISQDPKSGEEIKKDRDVRISISKGSRTVLSPNLNGLPASQARIILEENGLCAGELSVTYSNAVQKDGIISHTPPPGIMISRGTCVDLLVSNGVRPTAYEMPNLSGRPLAETILMLDTMNMRIGDIKSVFRQDKQGNTVFQQDPPSGHRVFEGFRVNLIVNRPPGKVDREILDDAAGVHLFRYRLDDGFLKRRIRIRLNSFGASIDLFNGFLRPGEEIWQFVPKNRQASLFLYEDGKLISSRLYDEWNSEIRTDYGPDISDFELWISDFGFVTNSEGIDPDY